MDAQTQIQTQQSFESSMSTAMSNPWLYLGMSARPLIKDLLFSRLNHNKWHNLLMMPCTIA